MTEPALESVVVPVHADVLGGQDKLAEMYARTDAFENLDPHIVEEINEVAREVFRHNGIDPDEHRLYVKVLQETRINGLWLSDCDMVGIRYTCGTPTPVT